MRTGLATLDQIKRSLTSQSMPMVYKKMLIKGILLPQMTYGIDIYGFRYDNLQQIKTVLNKAIRLATYCKNICISTALDEFNIMPAEAF